MVRHLGGMLEVAVRPKGMYSRQELADTLRELTRKVEEKTRLAKAKDAASGVDID